MNKTIKTSVYLPEDAIEALEKIAFKCNTTKANILRQAIGTEIFIDEEREKGNKILIEYKDGSMREIIFK